MSSTEAALEEPELLETEWDLEPLVDGQGADGALAKLDEADERATRFAERHAGKVAELDGAGLAEAMRELAAIEDLAGRAGVYAGMRFSTNTLDPERGALMQR